MKKEIRLKFKLFRSPIIALAAFAIFTVALACGSEDVAAPAPASR